MAELRVYGLHSPVKCDSFPLVFVGFATRAESIHQWVPMSYSLYIALASVTEGHLLSSSVADHAMVVEACPNHQSEGSCKDSLGHLCIECKVSWLLQTTRHNVLMHMLLH